MRMTKISGLINRNGIYYLKRRVPKQYEDVEHKKKISRSLHTDSLNEAREKAQEVWENLISGWQARMVGRDPESKKYFEAAQKTAKLKGFKHLPMDEVLHLPTDAFLSRLRSIGMQNKMQTRMDADALMGTVDIPKVTISEALEEFWQLAKDETLGKSPDQIRKWERPHKKAFKNLIDICGDKPISELSHYDMVDLRNWWIYRIENENLKPETANKDFIHIGKVLNRVNEMCNLGLDIPVRGYNLREGKENTRKPFSEHWIRGKLLAQGALDDLNLQARTIFLAMINTGARLSEVANLLPDHIVLDHDYPHIAITNKGRGKNARQLKSKHSERLIPLIGVSLDAMRNCPDGFPQYHDRASSLSALLNKYLTNNGLRETPEHSVYGLRHSFEDRLRLAKVDDRVRAELFGHSYHRERYGVTQLPELTDAVRPAAIII